MEFGTDFLKVLEFLTTHSGTLNVACTVISFCAGFVAYKLLEIKKRYTIRKCLSLKNKKCRIILPRYIGKLHNPNDAIEITTIGDIEAANYINDLVHLAGLESVLESVTPERLYQKTFGNYNTFCIGGSLANLYSYDLFKIFFKNLKLYATIEKAQNNPNKIPLEHFCIDENKRGFKWGDNETQEFIVEEDERYAIIVKLSDQDFNIENHGTVHILFGNGIEGTLTISKYLLYNHRDLYKKTNKKKHYVIAFKLKRYSQVIDMNSFIDLTDELFASEKNLPTIQKIVRYLKEQFNYLGIKLVKK